MPSGNFGNICAGHVARMMGLPIRQPGAGDQRERRARRVLPHRHLPRARQRRDARDLEPVDGHQQGVQLRALRVRPARPRRRRARASCSAPSCARDGALHADAGRVRARVAAASASSPGSSTHADRLATIRDTWQRFGVMIDTHTADGLKVAREHRDAGRADDRARNRAAGQVRGHDPRGAGPARRRPSGRPRCAASRSLPKRFTVMAGRRGGRQALHRSPLHTAHRDRRMNAPRTMLSLDEALARLVAGALPHAHSPSPSRLHLRRARPRAGRRRASRRSTCRRPTTPRWTATRCARPTCRSPARVLPVSSASRPALSASRCSRARRRASSPARQVPAGADAVVMQEQCEPVRRRRCRARQHGARGRAVDPPPRRRRAAAAPSCCVAGTRLTPQALGLAASVGAARCRWSGGRAWRCSPPATNW